MEPSHILTYVKFIKDIERKYSVAHAWLPKKSYKKNIYLLKKHQEVNDLKLDYLNLLFESKSNIKKYIKVFREKEEAKDEVERLYYENHINHILCSLEDFTHDLGETLESLVCENNLYRAMEITENHIAPKKPTEW